MNREFLEDIADSNNPAYNERDKFNRGAKTSKGYQPSKLKRMLGNAGKHTKKKITLYKMKEGEG